MIMSFLVYLGYFDTVFISELSEGTVSSCQRIVRFNKLWTDQSAFTALISESYYLRRASTDVNSNYNSHIRAPFPWLFFP